MKKVITYGTFDLLHQGHVNLLRRAKELGDWLIVGVTTDKFDQDRGKLNTCDDLMTRIEAVKKTGYADQVVLEEYKGQKIDDIRRYGVDIFAIGSDWEGYFDYLKEYCEVVYLPRTEGISSTQLRDEQKPVRIGIVGEGERADVFVREAKYIHGAEVVTSGPCDAVYVDSPLPRRYDDVKSALEAGRHVLAEPPFAPGAAALEALFRLADEKGVLLMPAVATACCPGFGHLYTLLKSGVIGGILDLDVSLPVAEEAGPGFAGCLREYGCTALLPIVQFLGADFRDVAFHSRMDRGVDVFTKAVLRYDKAVATVQVGLGTKSEGCLVVSGTKGYAHVTAPWWKTDYFEIRPEGQDRPKKYFYPFAGEGLRYEIKDFVSSILQGTYQKLTRKELLAMTAVLERYIDGNNVFFI